MASKSTSSKSTSSSSKSTSSSSKSTSSSPQRASVTVKTPTKVTLAPSTKKTMYSGGGGSGGGSMKSGTYNASTGQFNSGKTESITGGSSSLTATESNVPLYDKNAIQSKVVQLQKELGISPSQALNLALYNSTSPLRPVGGTVYDSAQGKNILASGAELMNIRSAQNALRQLGYTPSQAYDMAVKYKGDNPFTALNQNENLRNTPYVQAPVDNSAPISSITPVTNAQTTNDKMMADTTTPTSNTTAFVPRTGLLNEKYLSAGEGDTVVSEENLMKQYRGKYNIL